MIRVDPVFTFTPKAPSAARWGDRWCHLFADTPAELPVLHRVARAIGLGSYFQDHGTLPHYDVTERRRPLALRAGAVEGTNMDLRRAIRAFGEAAA